jgi:hypothetical protein
MTILFQQFEPRPLLLLQSEQITLARLHDAAYRALQQQLGAGPGRLAGANLGQQGRLVQYPLDHDFDLAAALLAPEQPGRNNHGVVEHQQIAGLDAIDNLDELPIRERFVQRIHQQHARGAALGQRRLRNQFLRQLVIEIAESHRRDQYKKRRMIPTIHGAQYQIRGSYGFWGNPIRLSGHGVTTTCPGFELECALRAGMAELVDAADSKC